MLCSLLGCGSSGSAVKGAVTFDGESMNGGRIFFLPDGEPVGRPTVEVPIENGKYCVREKMGLRPGKHRVEIVWHKAPPGKEHLKPGDPGFTTDNWIQTIPAAYNSKTTLFAELRPGANTFDFALKKP